VLSWPPCSSIARLLGLSAFAGFSVFLVAYPLGDYLAKKNVDIHKRAMASRDRKMAILDELLLAVSDLSSVLDPRLHRIRSNSSNSLLGRNAGSNVR
jgi:hypothetical protein